MGVAHTLSRTFFWSENILWKKDIADRQVTIFLSGNDSIVNAPLVRAYLRDGVEEGQQNVKHSENPADNGRLNVIFGENLKHGQMFDLKVWRMRLLDEVLVHTGAKEDQR